MYTGITRYNKPHSGSTHTTCSPRPFLYCCCIKMRRHRPHLLLAALCGVCPCRGWTPAALSRVLPRQSNDGASAVTCSRTVWRGADGARRRHTTHHTTTVVAATSARNPWGLGGPEGLGSSEGLGGPAGLGGPEGPEDETQAKKPLPR